MRARLPAEKTPWLLLLVFVLLSAGIAAVGLSYYAAQKATILEEERNQLAAIADLKIGQIEAWRLERLGDASIIGQNTRVNAQVQEFLASGAAGLHRREILVWLDSLAQAYDYAEAVLVAPDGSVRLASPPTAAWIGPLGQAMVDEVLQTGEPAFSDLHHAGPEAMVRLDLVIPLRVEDGRDSRTIGILILRIDPSINLFPLVQSWPTSSPSAETLLVRREGDQVLYLNELRHVSDPPLTLSLPITRTDLPAAMAVQGGTGIVEGRDYRGVPVMAVLRPVPNTSWYMVAKIDREEIYAPIAGRGWVVGGVVAILILAAAASIGSLWRSQRAEFVRGQVETELERKVLTEHFGYLSKYANDAILLADEHGHILEANERAQATYGYAREELLELNLADLRPLETRGALASQLQQVAELGGEVFETLHARKDGTTFPVEVSARIIAVEGKRYYQGIIRDITERKKAEERILRLNRMYAVLSQTNQAVVRVREKQAFLEEVCKVAVEHGKFRMAWIGWLDPETGTVRPVAHAGEDGDFLARIRVSARDGPDGQGPIGVAIRTRRCDVCNDILSDPRTAPRREEAFAHGYRASAAVPLTEAGKVVGTLAVYASEVGFFDQEEIHLLDELGVDISFALDAIRQAAQRREAEEALRQSEHRLRRFSESGLIGVIYWNMDGQITDANGKFLEMVGYTRDELASGQIDWADMTPPEYRYLDDASVAELRATGVNKAPFEKEYIRKDGTRIPIILAGAMLDEERFNGMAFVLDITERKRAEERQAIQERIVTIFLTVSDDEMYNEVLKVVLEAMGSQYGVFGYIDDDGALVVPSMTRHIWDKCQVADKTFIFPRPTWGDSSWPRAIRERRPNYSNEVSTKTPEGHVSIQRHISLPILLQGEVIGLLQVANKEADYTEADVQSLELIAGHIAPILSARLQRKRAEQQIHKLNEELEQRVVERTAEVESRNRELSVLYTIGQATAQSLKLEETLNNAVEATVEALDVEVGGIYLLEPDGEMLRLRVHRGISDETAKNLEWVKLGEGMSGKATAEKKPLVLDLQHYPSQRLAPHIVQENLQSSVSVPLLSGGQAVGAINLSTRRVRAFPPEEMALLTAIGQQLGSAVQSARLYEGVHRELAERTHAEQQLRESTAQLEAANRELEAFSYSVSHDLRAPLRAIDGFSRIVLDEHAPALAPEAQRYLHLVQDNIQQMGRLVDDLLAFSGLSRQPMSKQRVDPRDLVHAALQDLHAEQAGRQIDLVIRDLPACQADPVLLKQVWVNLLSNALKFTRRRERAVIEVGAYKEDTPPAYYVKDNGVGFDMRYVGKLFGVFQRLHKAEEYEGTGVGLAIVQRIIHRHGGRVWAEAKIDEGAMFFFTLEGGSHNDEDHGRDPAGRGQSE